MGKPALPGMALGAFYVTSQQSIDPTAQHLQKVTGLVPNHLSQSIGNSLYQEKNVSTSRTVDKGPANPILHQRFKSGPSYVNLSLPALLLLVWPSWVKVPGEGGPESRWASTGHDFV